MSDANDALFLRVKAAIDLKGQVDDGTLIVLDSQRVHDALTWMMASKTGEAVRIKRFNFRENRQLWGLVFGASACMLAAVVLSVVRIF
jgi:hypothetical protein